MCTADWSSFIIITWRCVCVFVRVHRVTSSTGISASSLTALSALFPWPRLSPLVYLLYTRTQGSSVFLNLSLTEIAAELLTFNFNTVIFNISHHTPPPAHPAILSTFCLDLADIFSLVANSHFVVENEMSLFPSDWVTLWAAGSAHVFALIFCSVVAVFFFLISVEDQTAWRLFFF